MDKFKKRGYFNSKNEDISGTVENEEKIQIKE